MQKLLHPYSPYHPSGAVSGAVCCREKPVDAGGAFCYNVKAINGAVLKWSKRRDSKSRRPRKGCQGSNPCCSAKPNGQMNFIRLSILFCRNSARCTLSFWGLASCGCIAIAQTFQHSLCRRKFGSVVQVGIDVGGGGEVAVAQPFLDLLHGNAVC